MWKTYCILKRNTIITKGIVTVKGANYIFICMPDIKAPKSTLILPVRCTSVCQK